MGLGVQRHATVALPPGKRRGTHSIGGWVGPRAGLEGLLKISTLPGFDPRTVQLLASRYTDPHQYVKTLYCNVVLLLLFS
jgi:hypothetical protein